MNKIAITIAVALIALLGYMASQCAAQRHRVAPDAAAAAAEFAGKPADEHPQAAQQLEMPRLVRELPQQILTRVGYTTSYNSATKNPNWVAWHLTREHTTGPYSRKGVGYAVDQDIVGDRQELDDWRKHGLPVNHGHMCPAGDNKWSREAMEQTFLLSNMCPQNKDLNGGDWEKLERRCRGWAKQYGEVFIACGPIYATGSSLTMGNGVAVPDAFFKVVLCMERKPRALGFVYPNTGDSHPMEHYVMSVDEVEQLTGIDFFFNLPDEIEAAVEAHADLRQW